MPLDSIVRVGIVSPHQGNITLKRLKILHMLFLHPSIHSLSNSGSLEPVPAVMGQQSVAGHHPKQSISNVICFTLTFSLP